MLAPGDKFDRYVIAGLLGQGGMGEVYRAHDTRLQRTVALKIVREAQLELSQPGTRSGARVLREARSAAAFNHPNVVAVFDVGAADGAWFLAMELVVGSSMRAFIGDPSVSLEEKLRWSIDVARALSAAHQRGIVHRDLKPENVMVGEDGVVKVLDFGIARRVGAPVDPSASTRSSVETLTGTGVVVGTPRYMAPEQLQALPVTVSTDVFAWGVLVHELFAGKSPWRAAAGVSLVSEILSATPEPLLELVAGIRPPLAAIVQRAIAKDPRDRPSADDILAALGADTAKRRVSIQPPSQQVAATSSTRSQLAASVSPGASSGRALRAFAALGGAGGLALGAWLLVRSRTPALVPPPPSKPLRTEASSSDREAEASYELARQLAQDASTDGAVEAFDDARKRDPLFAAAHLRRATTVAWMDAAAREAYERAVQLREQLDARDRALLEANEPWSRFEPDANERVQRLAAAQARWPGDLEVALELCRASVARGDGQGADAACDRALAINGDVAEAWHEKGLARSLGGDANGAAAAYGECLSRVSTSSDCLRELMQLHANEGTCAEALRYARRLVAARPMTWTPYESLAAMLAGSGEAKDSVDVALARAWDHAPDDVKARERPGIGARVGELFGQLAEASAALESLQTSMDPSPVEMDHFVASRALWGLAIETGKPAVAARVAADFTKKHLAWTADPRFAPVLSAEAIGYRTGASPRETWVATRAAWLASEERRPLDSRLLGVSAADRWWTAFVEPAMSAADAQEAIAASPSSSAPGILREDARWDEAVGAMHLLAGHPADAVPFLARASATCDPLADPIAQVKATAELGVAKEALGQSDAACRAYEWVLSRWGSAKPASVTATDARARAKRLGCRP